MTLRYMQHPHHGVFLVYSDEEQKLKEESGWFVIPAPGAAPDEPLDIEAPPPLDEIAPPPIEADSIFGDGGEDPDSDPVREVDTQPAPPARLKAKGRK
jgi:hypothetical protein